MATFAESQFPRQLAQTTRVAFATTPSDNATEQISSQMYDVMFDVVDCVGVDGCNATVTVVDDGTRDQSRNSCRTDTYVHSLQAK